jgi:hypothetical protein
MSMAHRKVFYDAWVRHIEGERLSDFDQRLVKVMQCYPEFTQHIASDGVQCQSTQNPYMVMGAHLEVVEQVAQDRPEGIRLFYQSLALKAGDIQAQIMMRDILLTVLAQSYQSGDVPDYSEYLQMLKKCC